jgi:hypothetical protein
VQQCVKLERKDAGDHVGPVLRLLAVPQLGEDLGTVRVHRECHKEVGLGGVGDDRHGVLVASVHLARRTAEARGQDDALADLIEADTGVDGVHETFVGVRTQRLLVEKDPAQSVGFRLGPDIA